MGRWNAWLVSGVMRGVRVVGRQSQLLINAPSTAQMKITTPNKVLCRKSVPTVAMRKIGLGVEVRIDKCCASDWEILPWS